MTHNFVEVVNQCIRDCELLNRKTSLEADLTELLNLEPSSELESQIQQIFLELDEVNTNLNQSNLLGQPTPTEPEQDTEPPSHHHETDAGASYQETSEPTSHQETQPDVNYSELPLPSSNPRVAMWRLVGSLSQMMDSYAGNEPSFNSNIIYDPTIIPMAPGPINPIPIPPHLFFLPSFGLVDPIDPTLDPDFLEFVDVPIPLAPNLLAKIPIQSYSEQEEKHTKFPQCSICLAEFQQEEQIRFLPCNHFYHVNCIDTWFQEHVECPICKQDLRKFLEPKYIAEIKKKIKNLTPG